MLYLSPPTEPDLWLFHLGTFTLARLAVDEHGTVLHIQANEDPPAAALEEMTRYLTTLGVKQIVMSRTAPDTTDSDEPGLVLASDSGLLSVLYLQRNRPRFAIAITETSSTQMPPYFKAIGPIVHPDDLELFHSALRIPHSAFREASVKLLDSGALDSFPLEIRRSPDHLASLWQDRSPYPARSAQPVEASS